MHTVYFGQVWWNNSHILEYIKACDILVFPYISDGSPNKVLEGMLDAFDNRAPRIHIEHFAREMQYLKTHFNPMSLDTMLVQLKADNPDPKGGVVTFDDGYYGVLAHAAPILAQFNILATLFVVTGHASTTDASRLLHFDEIEVAFRLTKVGAIDLQFMNASVVPLASVEDRVRCLKSVKRTLKQLPEHQRAQYHRTLMERLEISEVEGLAYTETQEKFQTLCWDEIRTLMDSGWTIGVHTRFHRTPLYPLRETEWHDH